MSSRICLITGTTHGIGQVTAREVARAGMTLVMACRDLNMGERMRVDLVQQTGNPHIECLRCDLASLASIRQAVAEFNSRFDHLDLLINNAGMMTNQRQNSDDGFELTLATNYLGPYLLTRLLLDSLDHAASARIVNVASKVHFMGRIDPLLTPSTARFSGLQAYAQSKQALVMFTLSLAERLATSRITANCLHPGVVATNIVPDSAPWLKKAGYLIRGLMFDEERGAKTTLYLALSEEVEALSGRYFDQHQRDRPPAPATLDTAARTLLWQSSAALTGLGA